MTAVIAALEGELQSFRERMQQAVTSQWNGREITRGLFSGKDVVLACSGAGKVNAALCTQYILDTYTVDALFFVGIAGSLNSTLRLVDVIVAEDCMQWDVDLTAFGYGRGELPSPGGKAPERLLGDSSFVRRALSWHGTGGKVVSGRILTGDSFVQVGQLQEGMYPGNVVTDLGGDAVEVEGGAAAHVCRVNSIPFLLVRVISDTPGEGKVRHFKRFLSSSSKKLSSLVSFLLKEDPS